MLIQLRNRYFPETELISIQQIDALRGISLLQDGTLQIRPLACFTDVSHDPVVNELVPALAFAAGQVGGPQIRHIGTIGGNICNGVTSADTASTLLAYDAELEITSRSGKRQMCIHEFYLGPKKVNLAPGELLTAILIRPESYTGYRGTYTKFSRKAGHGYCNPRLQCEPPPQRRWQQIRTAAAGLRGRGACPHPRLPNRKKIPSRSGDA